MLEIKQERGVFYLYVNGQFYCTCDNRSEVAEEKAYLQENKIIL